MKNSKILAPALAFSLVLLVLLGATLYYYESGIGFRNQVAYQMSVTGKPFESVEVLKQWLAENQVNEKQFIPISYDCDDFAVELCRDAWNDGYQMGIIITAWKEGRTQTHLKCWTAIGSVIYIIEPQNDDVSTWVYIPNVFEDNWIFFR